MWRRVLVCLCAVATVSGQDQEYRLVQVEQGTARGYADSSGEIIEFMNLPYATAPTGRDKFKAPLAASVWTETFDAVDRNVACYQGGQTGSSMSLHEDCLVANIYIPATNETNLPVVVYTHGGAYSVRSGTFNSVKALVRTQKIIAITYNYRLSALGFLCLGTEGIPGNAGMKDQVALVRWVKRNIASFGGNPDELILMGCSAGGGSTDLLTLSPMLAGDFKRAVIQSGCNMGAVGIQIDPIENAKLYGRILDFENVDDIEALEEFYLTMPIDVLTGSAGGLTGRQISTMALAPCVERDIGEEMFLHDTPVNIMQNGNYSSVPLLYGFTNMEGGMRQGSFSEWSVGMNERFADFIIEDLQFDSEEQKEEVAQTIKEFYFGDQPVSSENILSYVEYFTDILFFYPMLRSAKLRKESLDEPIYLFEYSFYDENTSPVSQTDVRGAAHCAQDNIVLQENVNNPTPEYLNMQTIMREYWISFILTGNPVAEGSSLPAWPSVNATWSPIMSLGRTVELQQTIPKLEHAVFWEDIYSKHYRMPVPPAADSGSVTLSTVSKLSLVMVLVTYLI